MPRVTKLQTSINEALKTLSSIKKVVHPNTYNALQRKITYAPTINKLNKIMSDVESYKGKTKEVVTQERKEKKEKKIKEREERDKKIIEILKKERKPVQRRQYIKFTGLDVMKYANNNGNRTIAYNLNNKFAYPEMLDITIYLYTILKLNNKKPYAFTIKSYFDNNIYRFHQFNFLAPVGNKQFKDYCNSKHLYDFFIGSEDPRMYRDDECFILEGQQVSERYARQYFKNSNDVSEHCFLDPILKWATDCANKSKSKSAQKKYGSIINKINKTWKPKFISGFDQDEINNFVNDIDCNITVDFPFGNTNLKMLEYKSNNKCLKHFKFINTQFNHVDLISDYDIDINMNETVVDESNLFKATIISTNEEMKKIIEENEQNNIFCQYMEYKGIYSFIKTPSNIYKLDSSQNNIIQKFELDNNINAYKLDYIKDVSLCKFIENGLHFTTSAQLITEKGDFKNIVSLDQEKAYSKFYLCPEYMGFLGKITDFRECTDVNFAINNVGLYKINNIILSKNIETINDKLNIFFNNNVYTSPELKFLLNNGCTFNVICGCWGSNFDFRFNDDMFTKFEGVASYSKWAGQCASVNLNTSFMMKGQKELFENLKYYHPELDIYMFNDRAKIGYKKNKVSYKGHITAFITAYQRLNMLHQIMKMDLNKIIRIVTDGIYYYKHDHEINESFRFKDFDNKNVFINGSFSIITDINIDNDIDTIETPNNKFIDHKMKSLYIGPGGTGKTHINLVDAGYIKPLYIAPSWKLATNKKHEYSIESTVLTRMIIQTEENKYFFNNFNVLIFDECSQYTELDKYKIFRFFPFHKIIMCGDIGYQLPPPNVGKTYKSNDEIYTHEIMNTTGFDFIKTFNKVYRFKCDKLKNICSSLRTEIEKINNIDDERSKKYETNKLTNNLLDQLKEQIINFEDVNNLYCVEDFILVSKNKCNVHHDFGCNCDSKNYAHEYNKLLENKGDKFIVKKNSNDYNNGDIVFDKNIKNTIPAHAFSIHSIQGETIDNKIFIDTRKMFEPQMLYTAISRARKLEQIYFIN